MNQIQMQALLWDAGAVCTDGDEILYTANGHSSICKSDSSDFFANGQFKLVQTKYGNLCQCFGADKIRIADLRIADVSNSNQNVGFSQKRSAWTSWKRERSGLTRIRRIPNY
jgi:hypothetical protein